MAEAGLITDIEDWIVLMTCSCPEARPFVEAVRAALDALDFAAVQALAAATPAAGNGQKDARTGRA
ncbi:hypothetical protein DAI18_12665 [Microvirgula aerodenitrificans]|uniref:Uncharacterized protein n=2 Tax=Microvirgula TaxID=57479 RepID=A0A2S0PBQ2_9NEIS|nr:hypothetical protein [Microvirgula aerodenitrificans]AVY94796.1 hypothetical protein DAI18_12665 [Microvirgula aerodenitrificans]